MFIFLLFSDLASLVGTQQLSNGYSLSLKDGSQLSDLSIPALYFLFVVGGLVTVAPHNNV